MGVELKKAATLDDIKKQLDEMSECQRSLVLGIVSLTSAVLSSQAALCGSIYGDRRNAAKDMEESIRACCCGAYAPDEKIADELKELKRAAHLCSGGNTDLS